MEREKDREARGKSERERGCKGVSERNVNDNGDEKEKDGHDKGRTITMILLIRVMITSVIMMMKVIIIMKTTIITKITQ